MINMEQLKTYSKYCSEIITDVKDKFLNRLKVKLDNPNTSAKSYWSIINNFLNNNKKSYYTTSFVQWYSNFRFSTKKLVFLTQTFSLNVYRLIHLASYLCLLIRWKTTLLTLKKNIFIPLLKICFQIKLMDGMTFPLK